MLICYQLLSDIPQVWTGVKWIIENSKYPSLFIKKIIITIIIITNKKTLMVVTGNLPEEHYNDVISSRHVGEDNGGHPCFDLSGYLTPGAGPAEEGVHAVIANCSLYAISLAH